VTVRFSAFALAVALFVGAPAVTRAASSQRIDLRAESIGLYPLGDGSALLAADGHVVVRAGERTIAADAVRFDLRKNRLVASGNVNVTRGARAFGGAAYALDLVSGKATLLQLDPLPKTSSLRDDDLAGAVEGPAPPATFAALDLTASRPYMRTHHAIVTQNANVRLTPAEISTGPGPYFVTPTYLYTFAPTNFSQSSLPAATFDQPYPLVGTANSLTSGHLRYDTSNGPTLAFDERLVQGNTAYAVASILPLRGKRIDLNAFSQIAPGVTQSIGGYHQYGLYNNNFAQYNAQWTSPSSRLGFAAQQFNSSNSAGFTLSTLDHFIAPLLTYKLQIGYAYDHSPGQVPFNNDFRITTYGYVASPNVRAPLGIDASLKYEYSIVTYDFPHEVTNGTATLTLSRRLNRSLSFVGFIAVQETANRYRDNATQLLFLPDPTQPYFAPDGTPYPGFFAYAGLSTYRTYSLQTTWRPRGGENSAQLYLTRSNDFPQFHGFGRPPYYATLDVTQRLGNTFRLDLARSYAFGWNGQHFIPQYSISISP
jgi:hypothetical protein